MTYKERQQRWRRKKRRTVEIDAIALKARIHELGLKQYWVAEQVGVSYSTLTRWLSGGISNLNLTNFNKLTTLLDAEARLK